MAREVQQGNNQQSTADVTVYVIDDNDHPPVFEQYNYTAEIPEHSPAGTFVIQVRHRFIHFDSSFVSNVRTVPYFSYCTIKENHYSF